MNSIDFMIEPSGEVAKDLVKKMRSYAKIEAGIPNLKLHIYDYSLQGTRILFQLSYSTGASPVSRLKIDIN